MGALGHMSAVSFEELPEACRAELEAGWSRVDRAGGAGPYRDAPGPGWKKSSSGRTYVDLGGGSLWVPDLGEKGTGSGLQVGGGCAFLFGCVATGMELHVRQGGDERLTRRRAG